MSEIGRMFKGMFRDNDLKGLLPVADWLEDHDRPHDAGQVRKLYEACDVVKVIEEDSRRRGSGWGSVLKWENVGNYHGVMLTVKGKYKGPRYYRVEILYMPPEAPNTKWTPFDSKTKSRDDLPVVLSRAAVVTAGTFLKVMPVEFRYDLAPLEMVDRFIDALCEAPE